MDPVRIIVPIALFIAIAYGFRILVTAVERIVALRNGGSEAYAHAMQAGAREARCQGALLWGLNLLAFALALGLLEWLGLYSLTPGSVAIVCATLGIANLINFLVLRRLG